MTAVIVLVGVAILLLSVVGERTVSRAIRLLDLIAKRRGFGERKPIPRSPWRIPAQAFLALFAPVLGAWFLVSSPISRRAILANIALGAARMAVRRGAWCDHYIDGIFADLESWVVAYGASPDA